MIATAHGYTRKCDAFILEDGSTDETAEKLRIYAKRIAKVSSLNAAGRINLLNSNFRLFLNVSPSKFDKSSIASNSTTSL